MGHLLTGPRAAKFDRSLGPLFEQRLAFHHLVITLSYFLYWHGRDPTQLPGCTAALRTELEQT